MTNHRPITIQTDPYNAETPLAALIEPITPTAAFYVRNHFPVPALDAGNYRLRLDLWPETAPRELSPGDLRSLPKRTVTMTMECAGNGRTTLDPPVPGVRWGFGAVGTATFSGASLRDVIDAGSLPPDTVELLFIGADSGAVRPGEVAPFARSLPPEAALHPDTLLAWEMNGEPLTADHGHPLRLIVPRWYGVASVKWLVEVRALTEPFRGFYQADHYVYRDQAGSPDAPVTTMRLRALIARPAEGETLPPGPVEIAGLAWSGEAPIAGVEISADGGRSWFAARLGEAPSPYAAVPWRAQWMPERPGDYTLIARAVDTTGERQPLETVWNAQGYGNNAAHRVRVQVTAQLR